jgi:hypothetical protein
MSDIADRLDRDLPAAWRPDKDDSDKLVGKIISIDRGTGEYDPYPLLVIEQDDGEEKAVHAFHTVLKNELLRLKPQIGERIGIKFLGEQKTKPGSKFSSFIGYRVTVDRDGGSFNWESIGAEPDPTPDAFKAPEPEPVTAPAGAGDDEDIPF